MTDAEWLRERPEMVAELYRSMAKLWPAIAAATTEQFIAMVAAGIPHLRAAIRADVVRELAGDESSLVRVLCEELVGAGFPAGDRTVVLANIRALIRERAAVAEYEKRRKR